MSSTKVQSFCSVPFAWENKPGISKAAPRKEQIAPEEEAKVLLLLPPPPPPPSPGALHRNSSKRGFASKQSGDPFLAAYMECTKSSGKKSQLGKASGSRKKDRLAGAFSCKSSFGFVEGAVVRMSELPEAKESTARGRSRPCELLQGGLVTDRSCSEAPLCTL